MPYFNEGGKKSPYLHQKKSLCNSHGQSTHNIPITKRPIEKVTTRSQAQHQQLIKTMGNEALLTDKGDGNNNHAINNTNSTRVIYIGDKRVTISKPYVVINRVVCKKPVYVYNGSIDIKNRSSNASNGTQSVVSLSNVTATRGKVVPQSGLAHQVAQSSSFSGTQQNQNPETNYLPYSPLVILGRPEYLKYLTPYEKKEIYQYPEVWFIGGPGIKKRSPQTPTTHIGEHGLECKVYGFDDNNGCYLPVIHDHIAYRYEVASVIGKGTFGIVLKAYDHKTKSTVALKVIRNQPRFHTQAKEEIKILTKLLENDTADKFNVVHMYDNFIFRRHTCIVFELLSLNLYELSRKNSFNGFALSLIRRFTFAIVRCLQALSEYNIIHTDLKPENILLKQHNRSGIKVIDFGSSCFSNKRVHNYIQSRYYRAPEVIFRQRYCPQIDMWSLGCILAELYLGQPLFNGENEKDQLSCMMELLGKPSIMFLGVFCLVAKVEEYFIDFKYPLYCASFNEFNQYVAIPTRSPRGKLRGVPGSRALLPGCDDHDFVDFVKKCLVWEPNKRMTPNEALRHPWLLKRSNNVSSDNAVNELMSQ